MRGHKSRWWRWWSTFVRFLQPHLPQLSSSPGAKWDFSLFHRNSILNLISRIKACKNPKHRDLLQNIDWFETSFPVMVSKHPCPRILQRYFFSSILTIIVENCGKSCFHHIAIYLRSLQMVPEVTISSTDIRKEGDQLTTNLLERFVTLLKGWGVMLGRRIRMVCFTTWRNASLSVLESVLQKLMAWIVELKIDQWSGPNIYFHVDAIMLEGHWL